MSLGIPDLNRSEVQVPLAPDFRLKPQVRRSRPGRVVESCNGAHQTGTATLTGDPGPQSNELTGSFDHEGPGENRIVRKVLWEDPTGLPEIHFALDRLSGKPGDPGYLSHLPYGKGGFVDVDEVRGGRVNGRG